MRYRKSQGYLGTVKHKEQTMNLDKLKSVIEVKSSELTALLDTDRIDEIKSLTQEVADLKAQLDVKLKAISEAQPVNLPAVEVKQDNEMQIKAQALLNGLEVKVGIESIEGFELKTLIATNAGFPAPKTPTPFTFKGVNPRHGFFDVVPKFRLGSVSEVYYVQGTRTNNTGVGVTEGTAPTDNVDSFNEVIVSARPVISWIPVSEAVLRSVQQANLDVIIGDVGQMLKEKIDYEMIRGDGGASSLSRSLTSTVGVGYTATVTSLGYGGTNLDYRSSIDVLAANVEAAGDTPMWLLAHPKDAAKIVNQKDKNDSFVWTALPGQEGYAWRTYNGLTLVKSANAQEGYVWVLGEQAARLGLLGDVELSMGYNNTDFTAGRKSIRALAHAGMILRPESIYRLQLV